jgi:hypothetical protein
MTSGRPPSPAKPAQVREQVVFHIYSGMKPREAALYRPPLGDKVSSELPQGMVTRPLGCRSADGLKVP